MANDNLKAALDRAGLTAEEFADIIRVDPRTVERWLAGRTPYRRYRRKISRALDLPEHDLWPDEHPTPTEPPTAAHQSMTGHIAPTGAACETPVNEAVATWGQTHASGTPSPTRFITDDSQRVDLLTAGSGLINAAGLFPRLREVADAGAVVRLHANQSTPELEQLTGQDRIDVRVRDFTITHAMLRADDRLLLILLLAGDAVAPLIQVARLSQGGLFDRVVEHFDACWEASPPLAGPPPPRRWPQRSQ